MRDWLNNRNVIIVLASLNIIALAAILVVLITWPRSPTLPPMTEQSYESGKQRLVKYTWGDTYLLVEVLDDDLIHFELSAFGPGGSETISTSPMVYKTDYAGPTRFTNDGRGALETADVKLRVNPQNACVTLTDKTRQPPLELTTICPLDLEQDWKGLSFTPNRMQNVYGLGEQFVKAGSPPGDWVGQVRSPGNEQGNAMEPFNGGMVGNAQFPIMYAVGQGTESYALFLDQVYKQQWDFTRSPWRVNTLGDSIRWYVMSGPDLADLRQDYVELVGHPPVPPKKMFGLWISEYGYDGWAELRDKLDTLRANHFPVDGFVLDLQWYGGITSNSGSTRMGSLAWDEDNFPNPKETITQLKDEQGIGIIAIEQSYVGRWLPEHATMQSLGYLARDCIDCQATLLTRNPWWGVGGMIDWTNDAAGDYWHDWKRQPLIEDGIVGHWTDLGEPELYNGTAWYQGAAPDKHAHQDIHNIYNLKWSESIYRGYARRQAAQRPFILSRSGAPGSQRFGVSMWSGDIGSNLGSLAAHLNAQTQMSMSGIDYFGSDIGGFYRQASDGDLDELYTRWLAHGLAFDAPARAHTQNLCNCQETAPDRIGDVSSNLDNVRQRYEISPYLYSLAHRAYLYGEPVTPPLVYYYESDPNVREISDEKLLGRDVLVASSTVYGQTRRDVYLPAGQWINYHTNEWLDSAGQTFNHIPTVQGAKFKLPMFVRAGAIIPQMYVDDKTMNVMGRRSDGTRRDELIVRVYLPSPAQPGVTPDRFTLYEDDGESIAYQSGQVRTTLISQAQVGAVVTVTIESAVGDYAGAPAVRDNVVRLFLNQAQVSGVTLDGAELARHATRAAFDLAESGWYCEDAGNGGCNVVQARSGAWPVTAAKVFRFTTALPANP